MIPALSELHAKTQRDRIDFLQTYLALCFTFADIVQTELHTMGDRDGALSAQSKAERGYETIALLVLNVDGGPQKRAIQEKLTELGTRLDSLSFQIKRA